MVPHTTDPDRLARLHQALAAHAPRAGTPLTELREAAEVVARKIVPIDGVDRRRAGAADPPGQWFRPPDARPGAILHLHGGGYVLGSSATAGNVAAGIAAATGRPVFALDYRLAPEHPFPAAIDDSVAAYRWLSTTAEGEGDLVISGDSAGGGLAVAVAMRIRDLALRAPVAVVGLSPWADLSLESPSLVRNAARDPLVSAAFLAESAGRYLAGGDPATPFASPVFADLSGLPPLLVQVGGDELLLDDARRLADAADRAGVDVTLERWENMPHVWHALAPRLPEATAALAGVGRWLDSVLRRVP